MIFFGPSFVPRQLTLTPKENFWSSLAERMHMRREYVKRATLLIGYGGSIDPWFDHILRDELATYRFADVERCVDAATPSELTEKMYFEPLREMVE